MSVRTITKKGGGGAAPGSSNTITNVTPAIGLTQRLEVDHGETVDAGVGISQGPLVARIAQTPAIGLVHSASGTPTVAQTPAIGLTQRFVQSSSVVTTPALELVFMTFNLTHRSGSNDVANIGTFAWSNPTNAQGFNTVTSTATMVGDTLAARDGTLRGRYANFTGKSELVISFVQLHFYVSSSGTVANNGDLRLAYRTDGTETYGGTVLETITGDVASLSTPRSFNITTAIGGSWSNLDALVIFVRGLTPTVGNLINYAVNAVELQILASVTDPL